MQRFVPLLRKCKSLSFASGLLLGVAVTTMTVSAQRARFTDVVPGSYYEAAVNRLVEQGIFNGNPDGTFGVGKPVERQDLAMVIDRIVNGTTAVVSSSSRSRSTSSSSSSSSSISSTPEVTAAGSIHFTTSGFSVPKESRRATVAVVRTGGKKGAVKIDYSFAGGSAVAGTDYTSSAGTLSFADGETTKNISVTVLARDNPPTRTLDVTLSNPTNSAVLGIPSKLTLTLLGTGTASSSSSGGSSSSSSTSSSSTSSATGLSFAANTYGVVEGGTATITVERTGSSSSAVTVNYATSNGSATTGSNYNATSGTLNFGAGETLKTFTVQTINNGSIDGNKTVNLTLSSPSGTTLSTPSTAVLTVIDDETNPSQGSGSLVYSSATYVVTEGSGNARITVLRQLSIAGTVSVQYSTTDGTAISSQDYTNTSGTLTFQPGETSKSFNVPIIKDTVTTEGEESVNLYLGTVTGPASLGSQSTATLKIQ